MTTTPSPVMATIHALAPETVEISRGLWETDSKYDTVNVSEVETYLTKHTNCYERTRTDLCRVYADLDGVAAYGTSEEDFSMLDDSVEFALRNLDLGSPYSLMKASQYDSEKWEKRQGEEPKLKERKHAISYRITLTTKWGSKPAVRHFVKTVLNPKIKEALADIIPFVAEDADDKPATYLGYDDSVYKKGRKMRMWNSTKDCVKRPNVLLVGDVIDTLLTYIPEGCERLPEPEPEPTKKPKVANITILPDAVSDPGSVASSVGEPSVMDQVIDGLATKRWNNYSDWVAIGMACKNAFIPFETWERNSRKGKSFVAGECEKKWASFNKSGLGVGTLWMMLKEDNLTLFKELAPKRNDFERLLKAGTQAEVAEYFYALKPNNYLYCPTLKWFAAGANNVWVNAPSGYPTGLIMDIFRTMKSEATEFETRLMDRKRKLLEATPIDTEAIKVLDDLQKDSLAFARQYSNKTFNEGVIAFLRALYEDSARRLCEEKQVSTITEVMDENRNLLAFNDAVYDVEAGGFRPIKQTDYITITTGYNAPTKSNAAVRKEVEALLYSLFEDDTMTNYLLSVLSTTVCGTRNMEEWYILSGRGGNGKGVIVELLSAALGGYFYTLPNSVLTKPIDKPCGPTAELVGLRGKRYVNTSEPESNDKILEGTTKLLSGGDPITARGLHKDPITFKPQFMLGLQCNNIPALNSVTQGSVRRIRIVPFPFQFVAEPKLDDERKANPHIKNVKCKSSEWRDEFMLMMLEKYPSVAGKSTVPMPAAVKAKTDEYIQSNNPVGAWFKENYVRADTQKVMSAGGEEVEVPAFIRSRELWMDYKTFSGANISDKKFKEAMDFNEIYATKFNCNKKDKQGHVVVSLDGVMVYKGWSKKE